jgi:hypothetical protein
MNQTFKTTKFKNHELLQSVHVKTQNPLMSVIGAQTGSKCQDHHLTIKTKGTTKRTHENVAKFVDVVCGCPYSSVGLVYSSGC